MHDALVTPEATTRAPRTVHRPPAPSAPAVEVRGLTKTFRVPHRQPGMRAALKAVVKRSYKDVDAVDDVSFDVAPGEVVGFLGPNGAGKTTTLKMLSGLLYPTSGKARVLGHVPHERERDYLRRISLIMGQRSQLNWDLPVGDSFDLHRAVYAIPRAEFQRTLTDMVDMLELGDVIDKPARNLSLGERMKCEIVASLLHRPRVLFLDEPTIGLDVTMQRRVREFVAAYNQREQATVLLTSHYMADVVTLCRRVIIIHDGRLVFDGGIDELTTRFSPWKLLTVELRSAAAIDLAPFGDIVERDARRVVIRCARDETPQVAAALLDQLDVEDLSIEDPPFEHVLEELFRDTGSEADGGDA